MPTFKHPCPHCGAFIARDVVACPACGRPDPFAPARCAQCHAVIEDPSWVACPKCGAPTSAGTQAAAGAAAPQRPSGPTQAAADNVVAGADGRGAAPAPRAAPPETARRCSGCGAPLPAGARFCLDCGTLAG